MRAAWVLCAALLAAAAGPAGALELPFFGRGEAEAPPPAPPRPVVTEFAADTAAFNRSIPGVVAAVTEVRMAFQTLGRMTARPVDVGDRVAQGDLLARLAPEDLEGGVRAAEAAVAAAEVNLTTAENTAERARALASRNVASTAQLEQAEQGLAAAQSAVAQTRAQLESARNAEGFAVMTAPIAGVISDVQAAPGAVVAAGDPIMTLSSEDRLEARIDLTETQLRGLAPGDPFTIWRDPATEAGRAEAEGEGAEVPDPAQAASAAAAQTSPPVEGIVSRIAPVADAQTRLRRVHLALPMAVGETSGLRIGSLIRARRAGADALRLTVPAAAVVVGPEGGAGVWTVTRQGDGGTVALTPVTLGATEGGRTEVTGGLTPGAEVVVRGVHSLTQGQAVGPRVAP
ncbi:efflux RND transporter periplasmic adaptor subunit [Paracoccus panacisoli]|uniref:RND family efflux transporter, MFP subunit n=2 Tax=Paracoccus TaxID=265 RepID=A0A1H2YEL6_9RHOB|nr:efflux RND transporter periplasmic adaptor subunit [Paracoccus sanguinis]KGJ16470.1 hypothetical protein IX57_12170 [Paracoccus sanguinis]SDX03653.1 RND family efflux transporter, MFP subunit [Paracoccus sanguinis]